MEKFPPPDFDLVTAVNNRGHFEIVQAMMRCVTQWNYGKIVSIASGTAVKDTLRMLPQVTFKGKLIAMTWALVRELGVDEIRDDEATTTSVRLKRNQVPADRKSAVLLSRASDFLMGQGPMVGGGAVMP